MASPLPGISFPPTGLQEARGRGSGVGARMCVSSGLGWPRPSASPAGRGPGRSPAQQTTLEKRYGGRCLNLRPPPPPVDPVTMATDVCPGKKDALVTLGGPWGRQSVGVGVLATLLWW